MSRKRGQRKVKGKDKEPLETFGQRFFAWRQSRHQTQEEVARELEVTKDQVWRWETDK